MQMLPLKSINHCNFIQIYLCSLLIKSIEYNQVPEDLVEWVESPQIQSTFVEIKKATGANYLIIGILMILLNINIHQ